MPFALRYKGRMIAAFCALAVASGATLVVPVALRRMIDFGFAADRASEINSYFAAMMIVAAVLAQAQGQRENAPARPNPPARDPRTPGYVEAREVPDASLDCR